MLRPFDIYWGKKQLGIMDIGGEIAHEIVSSVITTKNVPSKDVLFFLEYNYETCTMFESICDSVCMKHDPSVQDISNICGCILQHGQHVEGDAGHSGCTAVLHTGHTNQPCLR